MGFRFRVRKSIKVAPGVKVNIGKKSVGVSVGNKYGGVSVNSKRGVTTRVSVPGTGISYTQKVATKPITKSELPNQKTSPTALKVLGVLLIVFAVVLFVFGATIGKEVGGDVLLYIGGLFCALIGILNIVSSVKK